MALELVGKVQLVEEEEPVAVRGETDERIRFVVNATFAEEEVSNLLLAETSASSSNLRSQRSSLAIPRLALGSSLSFALQVNALIGLSAKV